MKSHIGKFLTRNWIDNPILVAGIGRSGTSVLLRALGKHPLVFAGYGEAPLMRVFADLVERIEFSAAREYYTETLFAPKEYLFDHLQRLCFEYVVGANYGYDRGAASLKKRDFSILKMQHWCAKVLPTEGEYKGLQRLFPGLRALHISRNGLDVVHSRTRFHGFRDLSFEQHCLTWTESVVGYRYLASTETALEVRHEELVADPQRFFHTVLAFLDMPYHEGPAEFVQSHLMIPLDKPSEDGVDVKQILEQREPPYAQWTVEQRETFKRIASSAMDELGYEIPF